MVIEHLELKCREEELHNTSDSLAHLLHSNGRGWGGENAQRGPSESSTLRLLIFSTGNCWLNSGVCVGSCMLNAFADFPQGVSKFL